MTDTLKVFKRPSEPDQHTRERLRAMRTEVDRLKALNEELARFKSLKEVA